MNLLKNVIAQFSREGLNHFVADPQQYLRNKGVHELVIQAMETDIMSVHGKLLEALRVASNDAEAIKNVVNEARVTLGTLADIIDITTYVAENIGNVTRALNLLESAVIHQDNIDVSCISDAEVGEYVRRKSHYTNLGNGEIMMHSTSFAALTILAHSLNAKFTQAGSELVLEVMSTSGNSDKIFVVSSDAKGVDLLCSDETAQDFGLEFMIRDKELKFNLPKSGS